MITLRKIYCLIIFLALSTNSFKSQLDLEHFFPPFLHTKGDIDEVCFYLSTDKTTPFIVKVFINNVEADSFILSKSKPVIYFLPDDSVLQYSVERRAMKVSNNGVRFAGERSFFVSLRLNGSPYLLLPKTEIIASKGKSALGKEFYIVNDQNILYGHSVDTMNYQASIMAYRNNTHVKISKYDKRLIFCNNIIDDEINITLNKGETYVLAALKSKNNPNGILDDNDPNLIGAKITSDQPIVINNGNFMSQDLGEPGGNINLDQSIPTNRIGKEYFVSNGMTRPEALMEKVIIVATKNNTKIYFNNESSSSITLNEGEYYIGPYPPKKFLAGSNSSFTNQDHRVIPTKGMYIRSSEPIYLFQLIGGFDNIMHGAELPTIQSTSGMLLSYPLDKDTDVKNNFVQIPSIEKLGSSSNEVKLTIKSEDGATIKVNNSIVSSGSPIIGKSGWSYYTFPLLKGDVDIVSDKKINADLVGGRYGNGFGSSYTSFSNDPYIIVNGNCIQEEVHLTLNNIDFEGFQWQLNGIDIPGATNESYIPLTAGTYTCVLSYSGFQYVTEPVVIDNCPYRITDINIGKICYEVVLEPKFTVPNDQEIIKNLSILTQPLNGTLKIIDEKLYYTGNDNYTGIDRFIYKICSNAGFCETFKATVNVFSKPNAELLSEINPLSQQNGVRMYDLSKSIINANGNNIQFFEDESQANLISNITNFSTDTLLSIYALVTNSQGCTNKYKIILKIPNVSTDIVKLANVITPNGDTYNDCFDLSKIPNAKDIIFSVYTRYDQKVFESKNNDIFCWRGTDLTGNILPTGTYWITLTWLDTLDNNRKQKSQWILIKNSN